MELEQGKRNWSESKAARERRIIEKDSDTNSAGERKIKYSKTTLERRWNKGKERGNYLY